MAHAHVRRLSALLAAALLSATTACTVASDVAEAGPPPQAGPVETQVPSITAPGPEDKAHLSTRELKQALLTRNDMPEGWLVQASSDDVGRRTDEGSGCERLSAFSNPASGTFGVLANADIMATHSAGGKKAYAIFGATLSSLTSIDAPRVVSGVREAIPGCVGEWMEDDDISGVLTAREIQDPKLGDESVALTKTTRLDDGRSWVHSLVLVRVDTTLIRMAYVNLTGSTPHHPDPALVRKQVEQVEAATRAKADGTSPGV